MLVSLRDMLPAVVDQQSAIACFNVFGFEDAIAVIQAAEQLQKPVIIATNKDMVEFLGVRSLAGMLRPLAEAARVPVCLHLDHCYEESIVKQAIEAGYTSVMFDGSQLPLAENIARTAAIVNYAHARNISVEGEIGSVPYHEGRDHIQLIHTHPDDAQAFAEQTGVDAVAVSVGNIHRLSEPTAVVDFKLLQAIERQMTTPLVIHGTTGLQAQDILKLKTTRVSKFNIGTSLRMVIGETLRQKMQEQPDHYDRQYFMTQVMPFAQEEAKRVLLQLS